MRRMILWCIAFALALPLASAAQSPAPVIGIVVMHGKGGGPTRLVGTLADTLGSKGYLVANL